MELTEHSVWILPALELNLCLQMLGAGERQVLPVARTDTPLNHRMLNSFLYLLELGLVDDVDASIDELQQKCEDAGLNTITDEVKKQYSAWLETRK